MVLFFLRRPAHFFRLSFIVLHPKFYWLCLTAKEKFVLLYLTILGSSAAFEGHVGDLRRRFPDLPSRNMENPLSLAHRACKKEIINQLLANISSLQVFNS